MTNQSKEYYDNETFVQNALTDAEYSLYYEDVIDILRFNVLDICENLFLYSEKDPETQYDVAHIINTRITHISDKLNSVKEPQGDYSYEEPIGDYSYKETDVSLYLQNRMRNTPYKKSIEGKSISGTVQDIFIEYADLIIAKKREELFTALKITP